MSRVVSIDDGKLSVPGETVITCPMDLFPVNLRHVSFQVQRMTFSPPTVDTVDCEMDVSHFHFIHHYRPVYHCGAFC
jgi:hypothetical protein